MSISLDAESPGSPTSFEEQLRQYEFELKEKIAKQITRLFGISNVVVLAAVAIVFGFDQFLGPADRLITSEVIMALVGATTVQLGGIMFVIAKSIFPNK